MKVFGGFNISFDRNTLLDDEAKALKLILREMREMHKTADFQIC